MSTTGLQTEGPSTDVPSTPAPPPAAPADLEAQVGAAVEQLFGSVLGAFECISVHIGHQLGLYEALVAGGPASPVELAARAGLDARYVREWLEQQTAAGIVDVVAEPTDGDPDARRFALDAAHAEVLVNADSLAYLVPFTSFAVGGAQAIDQVLDAYRTGAGVSFGGYGDLIRDAQAAVNRPLYLSELGATWLPTMPDVVARLQADPPALVADVGCGAGWSSIALATAFPAVRVHGIDLDEASIADARANAEAAGVSDRVTFEVRNAADAHPGAYDLVCMFESLHDTGRPIDVLAALRAMAGPDGTVFIMDEKVADEFVAGPADPVERILYAASAMHCLLVGRSEDHDHATGTMLREPLLRRLAAEAGYRTVDVLPIEHDFYRFYRLDG